MAPPEIVPFTDEHLEGAAALLAERHARHRTEEPLLPKIVDFREPVEREWRTDGAGGAAALADGEVVGYLIGQRREDAVGPHVWSHVAGHAVRTPEVTRDLYRVASARWVEEGLTRHFVFAPALPDLIEPWFRLSFGASAALAMRETGAQPIADDGVVVRPSSPDDLETAAALDRVLGEHLLAPPSFGSIPVPAFREYVDEWRATWEEEQYTHFVAERDGRIVGHALLYRRPADLRVPADSIDLANASTEPGIRGSGIGLALTAHVLAWAHDHGYPTMVTDWRMTNLEASRFWPRRGFRETFLRLYRSIP
jgi:predicted N-acetyltransferase YhbS